MWSGVHSEQTHVLKLMYLFTRYYNNIIFNRVIWISNPFILYVLSYKFNNDHSTWTMKQLYKSVSKFFIWKKSYWFYSEKNQ